MITIARDKFSTLTEQMFYSLMLLQDECCGTDIMNNVKEITNNRVKIGAGTLYTILEGFESVGYIKETKVEGRKRSYIITQTGIEALNKEKTRLETLLSDLNNFANQEREYSYEKNKENISTKPTTVLS